MIGEIEEAVELILARRAAAAAGQSLLVALSGIDASGKGCLAGGILAALERRGVRSAVLTVDGWLNPPARRFARERPAERFYEHAIRFDEMFGNSCSRSGGRARSASR